MMKIGVVGATGAVGIEIVKVLHRREFPLSELHLYASERSAGTILTTPYGPKTVELFTVDQAKTMDVLFLAVSGAFAKQYARELVSNGNTIVIDNSSAFRLESDVPLIIPEINGEVCRNASLIANPNCTTAIAAMVLWPIHCKYGLKKVIVSTYQAASGAGSEGMEELRTGTEDVLKGKKHENQVFAHPLPFNLIPHIDTFQENQYTKEEMKVAWETKKIFGEPSMSVSCTAVRIPIMRAHSESITIETWKPVSADAIRELLKMAKGVQVADNPNKLEYPMPLNASEMDDVLVGRIRANDIFGSNGLDLFVCGDQLLRGAALNAVLIAEYLIHPYPKQFGKEVSTSACYFARALHEGKKKAANPTITWPYALAIGGLVVSSLAISLFAWKR